MVKIFKYAEEKGKVKGLEEGRKEGEKERLQKTLHLESCKKYMMRLELRLMMN